MNDYVCLAPATRIVPRTESQIQVGTTPFHTVLLTVPAGRSRKVHNAILRATHPISRIDYLSRLASSLQCPRDSHHVALSWAHHITTQLTEYKLLRTTSLTPYPHPTGIIARPALYKPLKRYFPRTPWIDIHSTHTFALGRTHRHTSSRCHHILHPTDGGRHGLLIASDILNPSILTHLDLPYLPASIRDGYILTGPAVDPTTHHDYGCPLCWYLNDFPKPRQWTVYEEAFHREPTITSTPLKNAFASTVTLHWQQFMLALDGKDTNFSLGTVYMFDPITCELRTREVKTHPHCPVCARKSAPLGTMPQLDGSFLQSNTS